MAIPVGAILFWSGSLATVPAGYQVCDGTNGTPDLRDRFVPGAGETFEAHDSGGSAAVAVGGSHTHTVPGSVLTILHGHWSDWFDLEPVTPGDEAVFKTNELAPQETSLGEEHDHQARYRFSGPADKDPYYQSLHTHTVTWPARTIGDGNVSVLPWYWALFYIMKVA